MKSTRYLKYAIGEIVLVVIGILIAFQIDNWNQHRLKQIQIREYLTSMLEDLKSDTTIYNSYLRSYKSEIRTNKVVLENDQWKSLSLDSINALISASYMTDGTSIHTFDKINNSGSSETISTKEIDRQINDYYTKTIGFVRTMLDFDREMIIKEQQFWVYSPNYEYSGYQTPIAGSLPYQKENTTRKGELIKLIESTEGRNLIRNAIWRRENLSNQYETYSITAAKHLMKLIEDYLSQ